MKTPFHTNSISAAKLIRPRRFGEHENAFGFLRLLFASLVIVAHTPTMVDGDGHRELILLVFGGDQTFGGIAVSGFFIISGFLITGSFLNTRRWRDYLFKRIVRIYPAFIVMFLICLLLVRPIAGGPINPAAPHGILHQIRLMSGLEEPEAAGAFTTLKIPSLNGATWTIPYEFKCYVLVLLLGMVGLLRRPAVIVVLAGICIGLYELAPPAWLNIVTVIPYGYLIFGNLHAMLRLVGIFLAGSAFYSLQAHIPVRRDLAGACVIGLLGCLIVHPLTTFGFATFGTYLIFYVAELGAAGWMRNVNNKTDLSYGLYLYAWPVEQLLLLFTGATSLLFLGVSTWLIALVLGWLSWTTIEKPAMQWLRKKPRATRGNINLTMRA